MTLVLLTSQETVQTKPADQSSRSTDQWRISYQQSNSAAISFLELGPGIDPAYLLEPATAKVSAFPLDSISFLGEGTYPARQHSRKAAAITDSGKGGTSFDASSRAEPYQEESPSLYPVDCGPRPSPYQVSFTA
jgi:hypothetical protein